MWQRYQPPIVFKYPQKLHHHKNSPLCSAGLTRKLGQTANVFIWKGNEFVPQKFRWQLAKFLLQGIERYSYANNDLTQMQFGCSYAAIAAA